MISLRGFTRIRPLISTLAKSKILQSTSTSNIARCTGAVLQFDFTRQYAKGKQKEKARNKGIKFTKFHLTNEQLNAIVNADAYEKKLQKIVETLEAQFIKNLSLRSTTGSIETVKIKVDGEEVELQDIAQIVRKNPKTIVINMVAFPQTIPTALQALQKSGLNLNPQQEGTTIFIPVPKVTKEHRIALAKNAKALFNKCRDHIRDAQNEVLRKVKHNTEVSQDDSHSAQGQLTEIANKYTEQAEKMLETKEKELLGN